MFKGIIIATLLFLGAQYTPSGSRAPAFVAPTGPTVVQTCANANYGTTVICTPTANVSAGHILAVWGYGSGTLTTTAGCGTFTVAGTGSTQSWSIATVTTNASCVITVTASTTGSTAIELWELSGVIATVDGTPGFQSGYQASSPYNGPTITTTVNGDLLLAAGYINGVTSLIVNSPATSDFSALIATSTESAAMGHYLQTTAGAITPAFSQGTGDPSNIGVIAIEP